MTWEELEQKAKYMSEEEVDKTLDEIEAVENERLRQLGEQAKPIIEEFSQQHPVSISNPCLIDENTLGFYIWGYGGFVAWKSDVEHLKENLQNVPELLRQHPEVILYSKSKKDE